VCVDRGLVHNQVAVLEIRPKQADTGCPQYRLGESTAFAAVGALAAPIADVRGRCSH
jgi:hypothetical protein